MQLVHGNEVSRACPGPVGPVSLSEGEIWTQASTQGGHHVMVEAEEGRCSAKPGPPKTTSETPGARSKPGTGFPSESSGGTGPDDTWISASRAAGINLFSRPPRAWPFVTVALGKEDNRKLFQKPSASLGSCWGNRLPGRCWLVESPPSNALSADAFPLFPVSAFSSLLHFHFLFRPLHPSCSSCIHRAGP